MLYIVCWQFLPALPSISTGTNHFFGIPFLSLFVLFEIASSWRNYFDEIWCVVI